MEAGHSVNIGVYLAPEDTKQAKVFSASYTMPFEGTPWSLEASGYRSDSRVLNAGGQVGTGTGTNVIGNGHSIGLKLNYRLAGSSQWWRQLSLGVDFKDTEEDTQMGKDSLKTPLKYAPITLAFVGVRQGEHDQLSINTQLVAGTRRLFGYGSDATAFGQKRYWADPSFVAFKADVANTHTFGSDWQWYARGSLQVTDAPLVSAEQFAAGGMYTVRGYLSAEAIGDYGGLASLEWRTPAWSLWSGTELRVTALPMRPTCACASRCPSSGTSTTWPRSAWARSCAWATTCNCAWTTPGPMPMARSRARTTRTCTSTSAPATDPFLEHAFSGDPSHGPFAFPSVAAAGRAGRVACGCGRCQLVAGRMEVPQADHHRRRPAGRGPGR